MCPTLLVVDARLPVPLAVPSIDIRNPTSIPGAVFTRPAAFHRVVLRFLPMLVQIDYPARQPAHPRINVCFLQEGRVAIPRLCPSANSTSATASTRFRIHYSPGAMTTYRFRFHCWRRFRLHSGCARGNAPPLPASTSTTLILHFYRRPSRAALVSARDSSGQRGLNQFNNANRSLGILAKRKPPDRWGSARVGDCEVRGNSFCLVPLLYSHHAICRSSRSEIRLFLSLCDSCVRSRFARDALNSIPIDPKSTAARRRFTYLTLAFVSWRYPSRGHNMRPASTASIMSFRFHVPTFTEPSRMVSLPSFRVFSPRSGTLHFQAPPGRTTGCPSKL